MTTNVNRDRDLGKLAMWLMIAVAITIVLPPFAILVLTSLSIEADDLSFKFGLDNFRSILELSGGRLWGTTIAYAGGSSVFALIVGVSYAWIVARTNAWFRKVAIVSAYLSLSVPVIIKGIGWILLLGPNKGLFNEWLRAWFQFDGVPINLFSLGGMIFIEGIFWTPVVFLLTQPTLAMLDPALEEAAAMAGGGSARIITRITLPIAAPGILAVLLLTFVRSLDSLDVPLIIGSPGGLKTVTTAIYTTMHDGFVPHYGEASAFGVLLIVALALPLVGYYRVTRHSERYASVSGKAFRPRRMDLGRWRLPVGTYLLLMPASLLAPILILLWASFQPIYEPPEFAHLARMSWANYGSVLKRPLTVDGMWTSVIVASLSATAVVGFTFVLAWVVVRRRERVRWLLDIIASLPLILPGIVLGIAILVEFLYASFIPVYGTIWIIVLAFLVRFMPYGVRACYSGITSIHRELEECATTSGAALPTILRRIVLPLAFPAVSAIWIYVFLNSIRDLSLPIILSGPGNRVISMVILELWQTGEISQLAAVSVLLALTATSLGIALMWLGKRYGAGRL